MTILQNKTNKQTNTPSPSQQQQQQKTPAEVCFHSRRKKVEIAKGKSLLTCSGGQYKS